MQYLYVVMPFYYLGCMHKLITLQNMPWIWIYSPEDILIYKY